MVAATSIVTATISGKQSLESRMFEGRNSPKKVIDESSPNVRIAPYFGHSRLVLPTQKAVISWVESKAEEVRDLDRCCVCSTLGCREAGISPIYQESAAHTGHHSVLELSCAVALW